MALTSVIDTSYKIPGSFIRLRFGVGARSAGDAPRRLLLYGNKLTAGSATVEALVQCLSEEDARTLFGSGSELHRGIKSALAVNRNADIWCIPIATAGTAATKTITFTSGPATAVGTVEAWFSGERVVANVAIGDSITTVAAALSAAINDSEDLPVTASPSAGVVTVTARHTGPRGNYISTRTKVTGATGIAHTPVTGYMASGATMDAPANAILVAEPQRWHYHVVPYQTATELGAFKTHVNTEDEPEKGHRELFVWGSIDTLANTTTVAAGLNAERGQCAWLYNGDSTPFELACAEAARRAKSESADPSANQIRSDLPGVKVPFVEADWPTTTEQNSALNNGISPVVIVSGACKMLRPITNRSQNDAATMPDYSVLDVHKVVVPDFVADTIDLNWDSFSSGQKAGKDDPDGDAPPEGVLTPRMVRDFVYAQLLALEADGHLEPGSVDARADEIVVELGSNGRFNATAPTDVIEWAAQFAGEIRQIG